MLFRRVSFAFVAVTAMSVANCQCNDPLAQIPEAQIEIVDDAGDSTKTAKPWLKVDLGDADTGQTQTTTLKLKDIGRAPLQVKSACLVDAQDVDTAKTAPCLAQGAGAFAITSPIAGSTVGPGKDEPMVVSFSPKSGGPTSIFVKVVSNAVEEPNVAFEIVGRGTDGTLCAEPGGIYDFGDVNLGTTATGKITVTNCGVKPVTITTFDFAQNPDNAFTFTPENSAQTTGATLNGGDAIVLDVTFTPSQPQPYHDTKAGDIHIVTAAPYAAEYDLILVGNGVRPPSCAVGIVPADGNMNFGAVASGATQTRQVFVVSQGQCACTVDSIGDPSPADAGFVLGNLPALPFTLKGTVGCDGDPADASTAPTSVSFDVSYTSPVRQDPLPDNASFDIATSDPVTPTKTVNLEATGGGEPFCQLQVTPLANATQQGFDARWGIVDFGRTSVHVPKSLPIAFENIGNEDCTINSIGYNDAQNTTNNEFSVVDASGNPAPTSTAVTVHPGDTLTYFAVFSPTHTIDANGLFSQLSFGSYGPRMSQFGSAGCHLGNTAECNGVDFTTSDTTTVDPTSGAADPSGLKYSIGFAGTPVTPDVDVIPPSLDFGEVTIGCGSPTERTTIFNNGGADLVVDEPTIDPVVNPTQFSVEATSNTANTWPFTVPPGGSMSVDVRYHATVQGLQTATLTIGTVEGGQAGPSITVPLQGTGVTTTTQTDTFDQFGAPKVDVLWVVDDSGSMSDKQNQLAQNFSQFFVSSGVSNADFHIAVTTTLTAQADCLGAAPTCQTSADCGAGGTCVFGLCTAGAAVNSCPDDPKCGWYTSCSSEHYLQTSSANVESQFECNVKTSTNLNPARSASDSAEGGFRAAYRFLTPENSTDPNINGGFLRDDAKLHVIMVSDEPEQSKGTVDEYVTFFKNLKGSLNSNLVTVSAIATDANGCTAADGSQASGDDRYETLVTAMNGRFQSICNSDWTTMMSQLGLDSLGLKVEFLLSRAAEESSLQVCVKAGGPSDPNCVAQTKTSDGAANGWFYDATDNAVVFNAGSVPPRGSRIVVTYGTVCF